MRYLRTSILVGFGIQKALGTTAAISISIGYTSLTMLVYSKHPERLTEEKRFLTALRIGGLFAGNLAGYVYDAATSPYLSPSN